jgi:ribosomal protein L44E
MYMELHEIIGFNLKRNRCAEANLPARRRRSDRTWSGPGMARTYFTFGDIEGKLDVLRVECTKCDRKGRYSVAKLIEKHGRKGT